MNASIDFEAIRAAIDLRQVIEAELGPPLRHGRWACPIHRGDGPNFAIEPDGRRWRCWTCGARGDVFDFIARLDGISISDAARRLGVLESPRQGRSSGRANGRSRGRQYDSTSEAPNASPAGNPPLEAWQDPTWQTIVGRIVIEAETSLWSQDGRPALDWLRARGLEDHTIRRFRLGYVPSDFNSEPLESLGLDDRGRVRSIWVRRGITIPWLAPGASYSRSEDSAEGPPRWVGCNVRRLAADPAEPLSELPKCLALAGSTRGFLYPWPDVLPTQGIRPAFLVEGEIDALLGEQEVGHIALVGTVGGSSQGPHSSALLALAKCPMWALAFDHDAAGVDAARQWKSIGPHKARRALLPIGKDLGEFIQAGGNVLEWLLSEWTRFGWIG